MRSLLWVSVLAVAFADGADAGPLPKLERVMTLPAPRVLEDVALTDENGKARRISELAGAPTFLFFGFTHCPDVCPTTLRKLALVKASQPKELAGVRVVFISVDGERDSPAVVRDYLQSFSKDFTGLTAPPDTVRKFALGLSAPFFKDAPKDGEYVVQHSTRVYALDKQGRLRAELYDAPAESIVGIGKALLAE